MEAAASLVAETGVEIVQCDISVRRGPRRADRPARERCEPPRPAGEQRRHRPARAARRAGGSEESFDELIATNLKGPHFLTVAGRALDA
jgi:3-oxoacyl-[acyl-carrier protein] reductase